MKVMDQNSIICFEIEGHDIHDFHMNNNSHNPQINLKIDEIICVNLMKIFD